MGVGSSERKRPAAARMRSWSMAATSGRVEVPPEGGGGCAKDAARTNDEALRAAPADMAQKLRRVVQRQSLCRGLILAVGRIFKPATDENLIA